MRFRTLAVAAVLAITGHSAFADSSMPTEKLADDVKVATPFEIAIGKTTCSEAARLLGGLVKAVPESRTYIAIASNADQLYPGASSITAICAGELLPVGLLWVSAPESKEGPGAREAAVALASKYSRTHINGDGYEFKVDKGDTLVYLPSTFRVGAHFSIWYVAGSVQKKQSEEKARAAKEAEAKAAAQRSKVL